MVTMRASGIDSRIEPHDWPFPRERAEQVEARWAQLKAEKPALFDGRVLMARRPGLQGGRLACQSFVTGYKPFLCWRELGYPQDIGDPFMLGRMASGTANEGRLYFPAGTPEPSDAGPDGTVDFDGNILRELAEETGLRADEVTLDGHWTIVAAGPLLACLKIARSTLTAAAMQARAAAFIAGQDEPELDGLHAVSDEGDFDPARMPPFMVHYLRGALNGQAL